MFAGYYLPKAYRFWTALLSSDDSTVLATKLALNRDLLPPGDLAREASCCLPTLLPVVNAWIYRATHIDLVAQSLAVVVGLYLLGKALARFPWGGVLCSTLGLGFAGLYRGGLSINFDLGADVTKTSLGVAMLPLILWAYLAGRSLLAWLLCAVSFALHPVFGGLSALLLAADTARALLQKRPARRALAAPALFATAAVLCLAVWKADARLGAATHPLPPDVNKADLWNLIWLSRPDYYFAFSLGF